jgi:hypothetical protein
LYYHYASATPVRNSMENLIICQWILLFCPVFLSSTTYAYYQMISQGWSLTPLPISNIHK